MLSTFPTVLNEHQVHQFQFYWNGSFCNGMRHENEIYGLIDQFERDHQLQAYQIASELRQANSSVIMTVSPQGYSVWLALRSPSAMPSPTIRRPSALELVAELRQTA